MTCSFSKTGSAQIGKWIMSEKNKINFKYPTLSPTRVISDSSRSSTSTVLETFDLGRFRSLDPISGISKTCEVAKKMQNENFEV